MRSLTVYSPALHRPELLASAEALPAHRKLDAWVKTHTAEAKARWRPVGAPVTAEALGLIHAEGYVEDAIRRHLHAAAQARYAVAAFHTAALLALGEQALVCAPVSGFHHAGYDFGGGFCLFNGLVYTVAALRQTGFRGRILILDCDAHYGNGTAQLLDYHEAKLGDVTHFTRTSRWENGDSPESAFFSDLADACDDIVGHAYDLVLYQAGADLWQDDPLGSGFLTKTQMAARDQMVFAACVRGGVPCAWNFAGGYAEDLTVRLHQETHLQAAMACLDGSLSKALAA